MRSRRGLAPVVVLDTGSPAEPSGGQSVYLRNLVGSLPEGTVFVGASAREPIGEVVRLDVAGRDCAFVSVARGVGAGVRPIVPLRIRVMLGMLSHCRHLIREALVVYVHSVELLLPALLYRSRRTSIVFQLHGQANPLSVSRYAFARLRPLVGAFEAFRKALIRRCDLVLSVDEAGCRYVRDDVSRRGVGPECRIVPTMFDETVFSAKPASVPGDGRGRLRLVFVGRLEEKKGVLELVPLLSALEARGVIADLTVVGDGGLRLPIIGASKGAGLEERIGFAGWLGAADVAAVLRESDVLVLPSVAEGLTTAVLEALACGTPVVARDTGGLRCVVRDGENGFLVDGDDLDGLCDAVVAASQTDWHPADIAASVCEYRAERVAGIVVDALNEAGMSEAG